SNLPNTSMLDLDANTYAPNAGSRLIDQADPSSSVPLGVGQGTRADIGAFEWGSGTTYPYDFESQDSTNSNFPRIDWGNNSSLNIHIPATFGFPPQTGCEWQVDTVSTFDSQGWGTPLFDSGSVNNGSTLSYCDVTTSLPTGLYYARVRFANDSASL